MEINSVIDSIYVISIPKRKKYMNDLLNYFNIKNAVFIDTVMKDTLNKNNLIRQKLLRSDYKKSEEMAKKNNPKFQGLNNGRIACHLSHMKTLKTFLQSNNKNCLILEDDLEMSNRDDVINNFVDVVQSLPSDWEYVNLGRCWDFCHKDKPVNNWLVKSQNPLCRHAYLVSRRGAQKILDYCLPMKGYAGDMHYTEMVRKGLLNAYSTKIQIFLQNRKQLGTNLNNDDELKTCVVGGYKYLMFGKLKYFKK